MSFIIIYITHKNKQQAKKVVNHLLKKKLIACANIFPIESMYTWKNKIQNEKEIVSLIKTKKSLWDKIRQEVKKIHPYDCPCITKINAQANKDFEKWINSETK